jgi:amino-acid N-acetyltransferase
VGTLLSVASFDQIRTATINDVGGILGLIEPLEQEGILVRRSREKIEADIGDYIILTRDGAVIACAALHIDEKKSVAEVACLVVHNDYQKLGKGDELYSSLEQKALDMEIKKIFVLTTHAVHWFLGKGFIQTDIDALPLDKIALYNIQRNSKVLIKKI